jgi:GNAT superfamily N-acetyltransferase
VGWQYHKTTWDKNMILHTDQIDIEIRPASREDIPLLLAFIRSMAEFEKLDVTATEETLGEALFGEAPAARALLAFVKGQPVAYVTCFFTFASMTGKRGLWLDDIYIDPAWRAKGIGKALMLHLARIAVENNCARFEWMVLDWNKSAIAFYESLGAKVLDEWRICRMDEAQIARAASDSHCRMD